MQTQRQVWNTFQRYHVVNLVVSTCVVAALGLNMFGRAQRTNVAMAQSAYVCLHAYPTNENIGIYTAARKKILLVGHLNAPIDAPGMVNSAVMTAYYQQCIADFYQQMGKVEITFCMDWTGEHNWGRREATLYRDGKQYQLPKLRMVLNQVRPHCKLREVEPRLERATHFHLGSVSGGQISGTISYMEFLCRGE